MNEASKTVTPLKEMGITKQEEEIGLEALVDLCVELPVPREMTRLVAGYLARQFGRIAELMVETDALAAENQRLRDLLNTPEVDDFDNAIPLEAAHQVERWGVQGDAGKAPMDWFWLVGYLAGKALAAHLAGNIEKAKHHCISTAAVLRNWHAHIRRGETLMRPGISAEARTGEEKA
jgi:hypothetical protein